jgi:2'-5' RNA ligase
MVLMPAKPQQTAIIVPVGAIDVLQERRLQEVPRGERGMPAHVTVLYPFLEPSAVDARVVERLRSVFGAFGTIEATFATVARFGPIVYLEPEPGDSFSALTRAVWSVWPQCPPYEGRYPEPIPHATIARVDADGDRLRLESELVGHLPIRERLSRVELYASGDAGWQRLHEFTLG